MSSKEMTNDDVNKRLQRLLNTDSITSLNAKTSLFDPMNFLMKMEQNMSSYFSVKNVKFPEKECFLAPMEKCNCVDNKKCNCISEENNFSIQNIKFEIHSNCIFSIEIITREKINANLLNHCVVMFGLNNMDQSETKHFHIKVKNNKPKKNQKCLEDEECNYGEILFYLENQKTVSFTLADMPKVTRYSVCVHFNYMSFVS